MADIQQHATSTLSRPSTPSPFSHPSISSQHHQRSTNHHHRTDPDMSSGTGPSAQNMSQSSSSAEPLGFDLPPMPVPYEDFHFSLDLPDNIEASDLSLLEKGDFDTLFGPSSVTGTPSIVSASALFGTATPAVHTPAASSLAPRQSDSHATASHNPPHTQQDDSVMTSVPSETTPTATSAPPPPPPFDPTQGPPPPPDFQPPPPSDGQAMFSFDSLFGTADGEQSTPQQQQQQQTTQAHGHMGGIAIPTNASQPAMPLFDTSETDFLSDFLKGFEASWDFNPSLPNNMPSYAAAAAAAQSRMLSGGGEMGDGSGGNTSYHPSGGSNPTSSSKRGGRVSSMGSSRPAPLDFHQHPQPSLQQQQFYQQHYNGYSHPPHAHVLHHHHDHQQNQHNNAGPSSAHMPAAAAFGGHLASALSDDVPDSAHSTGSKRSFGNGRVGEEKRRGSLAQVETGFYQHQQPRIEHWPSGLDDVSSEHGHQHRQGFGGGTERSPHSVSHVSGSPARAAGTQESPEDSGSNSNSTPKRELLTETEKRQNHILSEQRRRNHIREGFAELVSLLDLGRLYGARGLGLSSGAGTGIEDEGLDDRTDVSSDEESDEEAAALAKARRKKARAKKNALLAAAAVGKLDPASATSTASRGRGKGRGRGGSAGGGAGSKSAVLFQAVDLIKWLDVSNAKLEEECLGMEAESGMGSEPVAV